MRRTKAWWARLTPAERSFLVCYDRAMCGPTRHSPYLPDDAHECGLCGCAASGFGACGQCADEERRIVKKAEQEET